MPPEPALAIAADPAASSVLLTIEEAAQTLRLSKTQFYNLLRSGRIGPVPIELGKRARFNRAEIQAWADAGAPPRREWLLLKRDREQKQ